MNTVNLSPLSHVETLIAQMNGYISKCDSELVDMYKGDRDDFVKAVELYNNADSVALSDHIYHMDTEPREDLVVAFAEDLGKEFVEVNLGYSVTNGC
jgi:hypothetical protein